MMNELFELSLELIAEHILQILSEKPLTKEEIMSRMWINNLETFAKVELALKKLENEQKIMREGKKFRKITLTLLEEIISPRRTRFFNKRLMEEKQTS